MKIIIRVEIGKRSAGCTRVGICSIEVELELFVNPLKPNQVYAELEFEPGETTARIYFKDRETLRGQGIWMLPQDHALVVRNVPCQESDLILLRGKHEIKNSNRGEYIEVPVVQV